MTYIPADFLKTEAVAATLPAASSTAAARPTRRRKPVVRPPAQTGEPVVPQSVSGFYRRLKWAMVVLCLAVYYSVPFLRWDRGAELPGQAVLFDLAHVRFFLFALEIRPQELYYLTAVLVAATIMLVLTNVIAGRIWCGYFCPQTVWTDLYLLTERWLEGDRREQLRQMHLPMTVGRVLRKSLKHVIWLAIGVGTGGAFVLYFVDAPTFITQALAGEASAAAYGAILTLTLTTYALAGFAREKMCTYMCPWPRLQGAVWDEDAFVVAYRDYRGEERMSVKKAAAARALGEPAGDCVDCMACVQVCPMGIDIREGPNLACINCGLCVDACDSTMSKVGRERGLIDYEAWTNIERGRSGSARKPVRLVRPKIVALTLALVAILATVVVSVSTRSTISMTVAHERNPIAVALSEGRIRNAYEIRLSRVSQGSGGLRLEVNGQAPLVLGVVGEGKFDDGIAVIPLEAGQSRQLRVTVAGTPDLAGDLTFALIDEASGDRVEIVNFFKLP